MSKRKSQEFGPAEGQGPGEVETMDQIFERTGHSLRVRKTTAKIECNSKDDGSEVSHNENSSGSDTDGESESESGANGPSKILVAEYQALTPSQQSKVDSFEVLRFFLSFEEYKEENSQLLQLYNMDKNLRACALCAHKGIKLQHSKGQGFHRISTPQKFYQHYERFHKEPITCVVCNEVFDTKRSLRGHMDSSKSRMDPAHVKQKQIEAKERKREKKMMEQKKKSIEQRKKLRVRINKKN